MSSSPTLLLTNDDGIQAPGLKHLWECVQGFSRPVIVAPHTEKSGSGLSITWTKPLKFHPVAWDFQTTAWSLNGTPADCVKMGCHTILKGEPQMILSGINRGSNAGRTVLYSGTIGAIIEGALKNIPGIAFSFCDFDPPPIASFKPFMQPLIEHFLKHPLPPGTFLNVNFPPNCSQGPKGLRFAKQGHGYWTENPEERTHPEGLPYYWLGGKWSSFDEDPESDVALLEQGYITVVPIHIHQLTDMRTFEDRKTTINNLFSQPLSRETEALTEKSL